MIFLFAVGPSTACPMLATQTPAGEGFKSAQLYALCVLLKGQCQEIFRFWFFSSISFPPSPKYPIKTVLNFFEHSRRYSQLKVDHRCCWHRWQMRKIFNQKNFNNFVGTPLDSRVNTYIHFCLQVHFKVSAAWYLSHCLPPVSTTLVKLVAKFAASVVDTGGKFATGVIVTSGNFAAGVVDTGGKFANFLKNLKRP